MKNSTAILCMFVLLTGFVGCNNQSTGSAATAPKGSANAIKGTYEYDRNFLQQHTANLVELTNDDSSARVLVSPGWQARVMTSTADGNNGISFGWLNYDLLSAAVKKSQFNPVGGEERFWLGPEGGQYSIYFKQGMQFNFENWQVPAVLDTQAYHTQSAEKNRAVFQAEATLVNYSGAHFKIDINRTITLLPKARISEIVRVPVPDSIKSVAYQTSNSIVNKGTRDWKTADGVLSIWLLGMFTPTPETVVMIPFQPGAGARTKITDNYFGKMPPERLVIKDSILFFTCDGKHRSKIGIAPGIAKPLAASYDFKNNVLTLVVPEVHPGKKYVNSKWELQEFPYQGDVINSYNDGPLADGTQMGPFYEIESSSPALELKVGETGTYTQVTAHLQASYPVMKAFVQQLLAVNLDDVR